MEPFEEDSPKKLSPDRRDALNIISSQDLTTINVSDLKDKLTDSYKRLLTEGYEPCEEDDAEYSEEPDSDQDPALVKDGSEAKRRRKEPTAEMEKQLRKFLSAEGKNLDSIDKEHLNKFQFKASFISHLCAIKEKQDEYRARL